MIKNSINLILQGKGGVGKSFVSAMLAQYFIENKIKVLGADTDPVNLSFASIKGLEVEPIKILENGAILQSKFDALFEKMIEQKETFVVDNGASTFIPIVKYIKDNEIIDIFDALKRPIYIHSILVGGQSFPDTLQGLISTYELVKDSENVNLVVWLNEFQGDLDIPEEIDDLVKHKLSGAITIENKKSDAYTSDIERMTKNKLTLDEVLKSNEFGLMSKNRLKIMFNDVFTQLDDVYNVKQAPAKETD